MKFMKRALTLAQLGRGNVSPNPMVGAVIVKDEKIIAEGYHQKYGGSHAEVNAINSTTPEELIGSTLYCNLEPCSTYYPGKKNRPCCDHIISSGIKKVVISQFDPNPRVSGSGVRRLEDAGILVEVGLCEDEALELNRGFNSVMIQKRPYVHLKWAQSLDGQIATKDGVSKWITEESCREETHYYRSKCDGIMVGRNTLSADNPLLDARYGHSPSPRAVLIDRELKSSTELRVFSKNPIIFTSKKNRKIEGCETILTEDFRVSEMLKSLPERGINSLFVEGGANLLTQFIKEELWDRITIYIAPKIMGEGISPVGDLGISHPESSLVFSRSEISEIDNHIVFNGWK